MPQIAGVEVSLVGLGCNNFGGRCDEDQSRAVVEAALDAGLNLFDTADVYGGTRSEEYLGRALGAHRSEVVVATKFGAPHADGQGGGHPDYVRQAAEASLRRLGTGYLDLYQIHFPDPNVPLADTLGALDGLVAEGKVRAIGCSNFTSALLVEAVELASSSGWAPMATVQNEFSLLQRRPERNLLPACLRLGVGFLPYFPLASGLLTGKYRRDEPAPPGSRLVGMPADRREALLSDANLDAIERLGAFAAQRDRAMIELAMSWLATRPAMTSIIAGATRPEQVRENASAVGWQLTTDELAEIDAITLPGGTPASDDRVTPAPGPTT